MASGAGTLQGYKGLSLPYLKGRTGVRVEAKLENTAPERALLPRRGFGIWKAKSPTADFEQHNFFGGTNTV